ncbi:ABC transporter ATP-binding protein [Pedococcus bigeumensis]|uniref:ATP-binding cassette domain-containing protein n=1 Tax=Pedococcus bigeumensis TaxID=433644 RepID=A0A502CQR5_9MICO|nr:ATP-binding cassette domain-containing protein [Pedococcus bigeumensis]TPG15024.1 ATP-binding cassette domain-containing protein [Pedococcus bigeumensis]
MFARRRQATTEPGPGAGQATPLVTLTATGVGKEIDGNVLLRPVDVAVTSGQCVVLRGENGSGKTTLLRILAGTLEPSSGSASLDGQALDERNQTTRSRVAALIGSPTAYRDLTLIDHLVLIDSTWGGDIGTADDRADAMLAELEVDHLSERFPHELSSGQQHLFHLAMVLFRPARVLLLDEPEQRLDTHKRGLLTDILLARKAAGAALVVACHDPTMTAAIGDLVVDVAAV